MTDLTYMCVGCHRLRSFGNTYLCPMHGCPQFTCTHCWDAHLALHQLADPNYETHIVPGYYERQVEKIRAMRREEGLSLPGKLASDS